MSTIKLPPRQKHVLILVTKGYENEEIANILTITPHTVNNHLKHIKKRAGTHSRVLLGFYALQHGLVTWDEIKLAMQREAVRKRVDMPAQGYLALSLS